MQKKSLSFVGIDPTAGRHLFTFAAFDQGCQLLALEAGDATDVLAFITTYQAAVVAVNAPPRPNQGLVRKELEMQNPAAGQLRGSNLRQAENELRLRGILVASTPSKTETCPAWMQMSFDLYHSLEKVGFAQYPAENTTHQWIETHPHAAFCALLGQLPLPKPTLEGRLQRQIALYEHGAGINDPMEFFEEVTRHKLLHGALPMDLVYPAEELDALMAAYIAVCVVNCPQDLIMVGDAREGQIVLPVSHLLATYK
jgi:hypothetical protein